MRGEELFQDLPPGWVRATIGTVAETQLGKMLSKKAKTGRDEQPYLRNQNVQWGQIALDDVATMAFSGSEREKFALRPGDLIVCEGGEIGRAAVWRSPGVMYFQKALHRLRCIDSVLPEYVMYALEYMAANGLFSAFSGGSTIKHLPQEDLRAVPIPLPPQREQLRIVAELERRLSHVDAAEAALKRTLVRIEHARQTAILAAVLPCGVAATAPLGLPRLPSNWTWTTLEQVADVVGGVTKDSKKQTDPSFVEVPYLRVANVQRGYLLLDDVTTIRVPPEKAKALCLQQGDVLFNEGGDRDKLGRGWIWEEQIPFCIHQNHVFRARLSAADLEPKFVSWFGNTYGRRWFEAAGKQTTNLASINLATLKRFPIPVPPKEALSGLVREVERRLSLIDSASRVIESSLRRCTQVRRAIIRAAVTGRRVAQYAREAPSAQLSAPSGVTLPQVRLRKSRSQGKKKQAA